MPRDEEAHQALEELLRLASLEGVPVNQLVAAVKQAQREADEQQAQVRRLRRFQGEAIAAMNKAGLSFDKIAQMLGMSRATVNRWAQSPE